MFNNEIARRYYKHEIRRLSQRNEDRKRKFGAIGRHFKQDVRDRFLMLLVYFRLHITYTLVGFLFDLDQSIICRQTSKRLKI